MPLPAPRLDDRRFQDLVDDAKRHLQRRCPEWTDHNVSDPGVTLIEACAHMVDQLLYRLNRVPDRHYLKFLELIGVYPFPPTAAGAELTFWLSAPRDTPVTVRTGTQAATVRDEESTPVVTFETIHELSIVPTRLARLVTVPNGGEPRDHADELADGDWIACFAEQPEPGDAVLFGLSDPAPSCAVLLRMECVVAGRGVAPDDPPLVWEAWTGSGWAACEVDRDTTGALNRTGEVVLHLPAGHGGSVIARQRAGWLRCRLLEPGPDQRFFHASPRLRAVTADTIGGTVAAAHAELVTDEIIGRSEGVSGQRFQVSRPPLVAGGPPLEVRVAGPAGMAGGNGAAGVPGAAGVSGAAGVAGADGWTSWQEVASFAESREDDRHVMVDRAAGEVIFGPAVRLPDGSQRRYGAVPPRAAPIKVTAYRTGGGRRGNVSRHSLVVLRDPVPFVSAVTNRRPAAGGVDGEAVGDAAVRGPLVLRTGERAVTADDYEVLARQAAPEAVRVRCVPPTRPDEEILLLVVPAVGELGPDPTRFADLQPPGDMLERIGSTLDRRRCLGARVRVEPPHYQGVTVVATVRAQPRTVRETVRDRARHALFAYLDPVHGGPDGAGWPFGRPIQSGDLFAVLQRVPGVELVEDVRLFPADPLTGVRGEVAQRIEVGRNALVFSYEHHVRVT